MQGIHFISLWDAWGLNQMTLALVLPYLPGELQRKKVMCNYGYYSIFSLAFPLHINRRGNLVYNTLYCTI